MMMPIPREGFYKRVEGLDQARAVPGIEEILVTAKPDQHLVPLPEGAELPGIHVCPDRIAGHRGRRAPGCARAPPRRDRYGHSSHGEGRVGRAVS